MRRVAVKFCGGCDPAYDRDDYWARIRAAAQGRIEWLSLDDGEYQAVLILSACDTACPVEQLTLPQGLYVLALKDEALDPEEVTDRLATL